MSLVTKRDQIYCHAFQFNHTTNLPTVSKPYGTDAKEALTQMYERFGIQTFARVSAWKNIVFCKIPVR